MKCPLGILENVPMKVGNFYVLDEFIVLDMVIDMYAQIILGRPFLATSGCKADVKGGSLTFDVGKSHVEIFLLETRISPLLHVL